MNLRQRIKQAKKELEVVKDTPAYCTWDIIKKTKREMALQTIIYSKRSRNTYYHEDDEYEIDWNKLTYVGFCADFRELAVLKTPNGMPLNHKKVEEFLGICIGKLIEHAKQVAKKGPDVNMMERYHIKNHIDYYLAVSNDTTKSKKLHIEKVYWQYEGEDVLYPYKDEEENE